MKLFKTKEILKELRDSIKNKSPFSLLRFGDGGPKLIHSIIYNDIKQLKSICKREGIPESKILEVLELWGKYARQANFIDFPGIYFTDEFWGKYKKDFKHISEKTVERMMMWEDLYSRAEFDNDRFCNPEINYLLCLKFPNKSNLIGLLKNKKICCISTYNEFKIKSLDITPLKIVGHFENQYENSFDKVMSFIDTHANSFDIFLVCAGELGRIYTGYIKQQGGRALDFGFVIDYWMTGFIPERIANFMNQNENNSLEFKLNTTGETYSKFL